MNISAIKEQGKERLRKALIFWLRSGSSSGAR